MAKENKGLIVSIDPTKVMYSNISTSKDGYNYASVTVKNGEGEYMNLSYEWKNESKIPAFVLDLMAFMKSNKMETSGIWPGYEEEYKEISNRKNQT